MGKLIDQLRLAGQLALDAPFSKGTLIDSVSGNAATVAGAPTPYWQETDRQTGIVCKGTGIVSFPSTVANSLAGGQATIIVIGDLRNLPLNSRLVSKRNAGTSYDVYFDPGGFGYAVYDGAASSAFSYTAAARMLAISIVNGQIPKLYTDGMFRANGAVALTISATNNPVNIGNLAGGGTPLGACITRVIEVTRTLTGAEHAQLWDEFLQEGWVKNLARKGFRYQYPGKRASEYAAEGIFFDTPEKRRADGLVADYTGNYPGTLVGTPVPATDDLYDGSGVNYNGTSDWCNHGNMSQVNGNTTLTVEGWIEFPSGNIPASSWWVYNNAGGGVFFTLGVGGVISANPAMYYILGAGSGNTSANALRSGQKQHVVFQFDNGTPKIHIDGEPFAATITAPMPATIPNFSATPMRIGTVCKFTPHMTRMRTPLLTDAQVRAIYLETGAKHLTLRETLEDVPVTLAASVPAGTQIGSWMTYGDTWACVESSTGRRSMKHIGAVHGAASRPSTDAFGTWYWRMKGITSLNENYVMFLASVPGPYNTAGLNGYMLYLNIAQLYLFRTTGGASASLGASAAVFAPNTEYEICCARRVSDCRFTVWARGGAMAVWTQVLQLTDTAHTTSSWLTLGSVLRPDEFPMFDPHDERVGLHHWLGQLDPTAGELPFR